jgi:hypothetical protein
VICGDSGTCFQDAHVNSTVTRAFAEIADKMSGLAQT